MKIKNDNIVNVDVQTPREIDIKGDFLSTMICQNLDHARHVENERLSFNSIFLAAMAGFVAIAFGALDKPIILYPVLAFLFGLSYIGLIFTERWTAVYKGHFEKAKSLVLLAVSKNHEDSEKDSHDPYRLSCEPDTNEFYYFRHEYYLPMLQERVNKNPKFHVELAAKYEIFMAQELTKKKYQKYDTEDKKRAAAKTPVFNAIANSYYKNTKFFDKPATYFFSGPRTLALFRFMYVIIFALLAYLAVLPLFI